MPTQLSQSTLYVLHLEARARICPSRHLSGISNAQQRALPSISPSWSPPFLEEEGNGPLELSIGPTILRWPWEDVFGRRLARQGHPARCKARISSGRYYLREHQEDKQEREQNMGVLGPWSPLGHSMSWRHGGDGWERVGKTVKGKQEQQDQTFGSNPMTVTWGALRAWSWSNACFIFMQGTLTKTWVLKDK